jgi:2'-5' RNA ligase
MGAASTRLFFALWPDPDLRMALAELAREVAREARGRATVQANLHLTLAFLGDQPAQQVQPLQALASALGGRRFELALDEIGCFVRAGIAWLGASTPQPELGALQGRLALALRAAGFSIDERPYAPHLTLARHARAPVRRTLARPIRWSVNSFVLAASDLGRSRPVYSLLGEWTLDPP